MGDGQVLTGKRKGRPPKSDPSRTGRSPAPGSANTVRRSLRRRNVRYSSFFDYDDFLEDDSEEELRKGKLVAKLIRQRERDRYAGESGESGSGREEDEDDGEDAGPATAAVDEEESERRVVKQRKFSGAEDDDEMDYDNDNGNDDDDDDDDRMEDDYGSRGRQVLCRVIAPSNASVFKVSSKVGRWNLGFRLPYARRGVISRAVDRGVGVRVSCSVWSTVKEKLPEGM